MEPQRHHWLAALINPATYVIRENIINIINWGLSRPSRPMVTQSYTGYIVILQPTDAVTDQKVKEEAFPLSCSETHIIQNLSASPLLSVQFSSANTFTCSAVISRMSFPLAKLQTLYPLKINSPFPLPQPLEPPSINTFCPSESAHSR